MSEDDPPEIPFDDHGVVTLEKAPPSRSTLEPARRRRPRVKKLRLLIVLIPLSLLALVSAVFGMIMAIASDLPALEKFPQFKTSQNSTLYDDNGRLLGILTDANNRVLVTGAQIPLVMKRAIISVEDKRFYSNSGIDLQGIGRAFLADVFQQKAVQGASTITQQFVKNALQAQNHRTIFEKLREAALAYHLTRKWPKDKILTEYLNTIYFGNGAYGIESAARTYFGNDPSTNEYQCGAPGHPLCVVLLKPEQAALLAGLVASPAAYDPATHPLAAINRRNLVLRDMHNQGYLTPDEYQYATQAALPPPSLIQPPAEKGVDPSLGYFISWVRQQVVDHYTAQRAFEGGLKIRTTLDLDLQSAAQQAVNNYLAYSGGPDAALVAIDNATGAVRALVGGHDYNSAPFNLATQGQRQPGSAFKVFVLAQALREGISPNSVWPSRQRTFVVPNTRGQEHFVVRDYEGSYAGSRTLADATTYSDNAVFAAVGIQAGTPKIANLAQAAGIRTPVSHNYAITLGGLHEGVTPLDMAHAYETFARGGQRVFGSLGAADEGPVGIESVQLPNGQTDRNQVQTARILPASLVSEENAILRTVVTSGTGRAADPGVWAAGKTGTTENYGDAWFVGFTQRLTVAVWVGYPNTLRSMKTDFNGSPVAGGTFPALIWHDFIVAADQIFGNRAASAQAAASASGAASGGQSNGAAVSTTPSGSGTKGTSTQPANPSPQNPAPNPTPTPAAPTQSATGQPSGAGASGGAQAPSG
jgi:penicillin-binding protein 1A